MRQARALAAAMVVLALPIAKGESPGRVLSVSPARVRLDGADGVQRLLVRDPADGKGRDLSREAAYVSSDPRVVEVGPAGLIRPRGDGTAEVRVTLAGSGASTTVPVVVAGYSVEPPVSFRNAVEPILTKAGCNAGGCHGKASGQNGFKLSLLGSDPSADFDAIVREGRGRRVLPGSPARSLLLTKASGVAAHGGGRRFAADSAEAAILARWIRQGTPPGSAADPSVARIEVEPAEATSGRGGSQQVVVTAVYSDGRRRDVTGEAQFKSSEPDVAGVDTSGLVRAGDAPGRSAVMARYLGKVGVCRVTIPHEAGPVSGAGAVPRNNYVDDLVRANWTKLRLAPSPLADDATFLRRAFLDAVGTLPTARGGARVPGRPILAEQTVGLAIDKLSWPGGSTPTSGP